MYLDLEKFAQTKLKESPFRYLVIENFIHKDKIDKICKKFPNIISSGSFPLSSLNYENEFKDFINELYSKEFINAVSKKFNLNLDDLPIMITARGNCKSSNGQIHIDSKGKILTFLIYFNETWDSEGGKLRLLNSNSDIDDYFSEIAPLAGTLIAFECSENAWHGHKPFEGPRKSIQLNWVKDKSYLGKEQYRHKISAFFKKIFG